MPLRRKYGKKRYGRKVRRGRKVRKYRKRYGKRRSKRMSKYTKDIVKSGTKYTTIYKTAIRVTSKPGTCNYVSLTPDPLKRQFDNGAKSPFMGDMSFYGPFDTFEAIRKIQDSLNQRMLSITDSDAQFVNSLQQLDPANQKKNQMQSVPLENYRLAVGNHNMLLQIKSAVTGGNVHITLYKCKARYSIPQFAHAEIHRNTDDQLVVSVKVDGTLEQKSTIFASPNGYAINCNTITDWHNVGWEYQFKGLENIGLNNNTWAQHQEGTTLYDNKLWCKMFKITKKYNIELVPGQMASLSLKQKKIKALNLIQHTLDNSYLCTKGQCVFILKIQGAMGHENFAVNAENQELKYQGGSLSRPEIGLMPAAVDVMCFKKLKAWVHFKPAPKFKNIVKVADYTDDNTTEGLLYNRFVDAAPSDYANGPAIIG